jgi:pullulanase/glycogen debranching enzyme
LGLASDAAIEHLLDLGVTAVELLPVHAFVQDKHLVQKGLRNYWGYNSIGFFAPEGRYAVANPVLEFKEMVKTLHAAGLEVILDVVYNHTAEGNHFGPTLSFKGIDNASYYRLVPGDQRHYMDYTGTGNSLNLRHPRVLQMVMDSLRYWVEEMHVDGFRFDLASTLMREEHEFDAWSGFARTVRQDPVLQDAKLIAEPWDVGEGGYRVGGFPDPFSEWNGKYRDDVRAYWKGEGGLVGELAYRLTGSSDLYGKRGPWASVNFVTAHDGFTLSDLVSYNEKHNEANGEGNRDGESHNDSWNGGVEGPTKDPEVLALRARQRRNFLATLLLSQGVPMILAGDEMGRTQKGNNNAYCQDNEISWLDWDLSESDEDHLAFTRRLVRLREEHPAFRRMRFLKGRSEGGAPDATWLTPAGREMTDEEWNTAFARSLGLWIIGSGGGLLYAPRASPTTTSSSSSTPTTRRSPSPYPVPPKPAGASSSTPATRAAPTPTVSSSPATSTPGSALPRCPEGTSPGERVKRHHQLPLGAEYLGDGMTRFTLWAPASEKVELLLEDDALPMKRHEDGTFALTTRATPGIGYRYRVDGEGEVPDPASATNPRTYTARARSWTRRRSSGATGPGRAGRGKRPSSTSSTLARSPRKERSQALGRSSTTSRTSG